MILECFQYNYAWVIYYACDSALVASLFPFLNGVKLMIASVLGGQSFPTFFGAEGLCSPQPTLFFTFNFNFLRQSYKAGYVRPRLVLDLTLLVLGFKDIGTMVKSTIMDQIFSRVSICRSGFLVGMESVDYGELLVQILTKCANF